MLLTVTFYPLKMAKMVSLTQDEAVISLFHKCLRQTDRPADRSTDRPTNQRRTRGIELLWAAKNFTEKKVAGVEQKKWQGLNRKSGRG
jgi:hypothetical protein